MAHNEKKHNNKQVPPVTSLIVTAIQMLVIANWYANLGLNQGPLSYENSTLTTELLARNLNTRLMTNSTLHALFCVLALTSNHQPCATSCEVYTGVFATCQCF